MHLESNNNHQALKKKNLYNQEHKKITQQVQIYNLSQQQIPADIDLQQLKKDLQKYYKEIMDLTKLFTYQSDNNGIYAFSNIFTTYFIKREQKKKKNHKRHKSK